MNKCKIHVIFLLTHEISYGMARNWLYDNFSLHHILIYFISMQEIKVSTTVSTTKNATVVYHPI